MFLRRKFIKIYCKADDFCKEFVLQQENYMIEDRQVRQRNKSKFLSCFTPAISAVSSIMTRNMSVNIEISVFDPSIYNYFV